MKEQLHRSEPIPQKHFFDVYTPETIKNLRYDSHLQDALSLLRQGVNELRDINGVETSAEWQSDYGLSVEGSTDTTEIALWRKVKVQGRDPFLLVDWNTKDGVTGVVEGREYTYPGTGDKAVFIDWVVVRNTGSNDEDDYSYRGKDVASSMYDKVESLAREHDVALLIAGVNAANPRSAGFHIKKGFVNEEPTHEDRSEEPYATENGAFIPPVEMEGVDSHGKKIAHTIHFYTKRLK